MPDRPLTTTEAAAAARHRESALHLANSLEAAPDTAGRFQTTHWSVVLLAGQEQSPLSAGALEKLCQAYWPPLYVFIRRRGYSPEDAQDLTQQFFALLLARHDFGGVAPYKGKFRTFLLTALTHFLANQYDRTQAAKRGGGKTPLSLEQLRAEQLDRFEPVSTLSPDKLFDQQWAQSLLSSALQRLREQIGIEGRSDQFDRLKPFLTEDPAEGQYAEVAAVLGMTRQSVAVAVHRLRQSYRACVRAQVAETVATPLEVDEELRYLLEALNPQG